MTGPWFPRLRLAVALLTTSLLVVPTLSFAQAVGQIQGVATDTSGGVLAQVKVTVSGTGLQQPLTATTSENGTYLLTNVPIGTYKVAFDLTGFKQVVRSEVVITTGFNAKVDATLDPGHHEEVEVTATTPLVDPRKTTTGGTVTLDVMLNVPTARDPWQVINLVPSVIMNGTPSTNTFNVGGSAAGQQQSPSAFGSSSSVTWNLEGGSITDMAAASAPFYFNFDSFQEVQVVTGGGDVSVQSGGVFINLITKSGSNLVKGSGDITFENASMQAQNVSEAVFDANTSGNAIGLSGAPLHRVDTMDADIGGPILKNRLWYWGSTAYQDINTSISNYFDTSLPGCNPPPSTFAQLKQVQACLKNTRTVLANFNGKLNYQPSTGNKFQLLVQSAQKTNSDRGATALLTPEATASQYDTGGVGPFQDPTYQITHTWLPSDRLVIVSQFTYIHGGFFVDYHDYTRCGSTTYARDLAGNDPTDPTCEFNTQPLDVATTGVTSRSSLLAAEQIYRRSWEAKTEGTDFVPHVLGGDHAFKFGVGWRRDPTQTYSHVGGGAEAIVQCVNNVITTCGDGKTFVAPGAASGLVPFQGVLFRDGLIDYDWHSYFGYVQDSFTRNRLSVTGGVRDDWQTSVALGGCVPANVIEPVLLPAQCQGHADPKQPFNSLSPRASVTYDVTGKGTTAVHGSFAMYYASELVLANALSDLGLVSLAYTQNQKSGACSTVANASCWNDTNHDGVIQASELSGVPKGPANFINGVLTVLPPQIDPNLKIGRTREGIVGVDHQLLPNVHVSLDYIYRYNDRGAATYIAAPSGTAADAVAQIANATSQWQPQAYTDPNTGISTTYYVLCPGCAPLTGGRYTTTSLQYTKYKGTVLTVEKRYSNHWQGSVSYNWNDPRLFMPAGSFQTNSGNPGNPTGVAFTNGFTNGTLGWTVKSHGSVELPFGLMAGVNLNVEQGVVRAETITGPGAVASGTGTINLATLPFQDLGTSHLPPTKLLDVNIAKSWPLGRARLTLTLDCFNVFNTATPLSYSSNDVSNNGQNGSPASFFSALSLMPPRIFRIDARVTF